MTAPVFAAIDLELTGLKVGSAEIIEIGVVRCTPDHVLERWETLVRPYGDMPDLRIQRLTGITPTMLRDAPPLDQVTDKLRELLDGAIPIGHNIRFDLDHLGAAGVDASRDAIDTLPIAQVLDPTAPSHRLGDLCARRGIALDDSHRALADAEASRRLLLALTRRWSELSASQREQVQAASEAMGMLSPLRRFISLASGGAVAPARRLTPRSDGQTSQPRRPPTQPAEPPPTVELPQRSLADLTAAAFDQAAADPASGMQPRSEQRAMALDIARALDDGEQALVEAGTGVGKSLAYLIPAALWAMREGARVNVSTHTRNLQTQLSEDDFGQLRAMLNYAAPGLGAQLRATTLKGRANYLCPQALEKALAQRLTGLTGGEGASDPDTTMLLARVAVWAEEPGCDGDREALRLHRDLNNAWTQLSAERAGCLDPRGDHGASRACFLARAFDTARSAHLTVVNHSWLISNLEAGRRALLEGTGATPEGAQLAASDAVIIDEAHFLEEAATNALRIAIDEHTLHAAFDAIRSTDRRRANTIVRRTADDLPVASEQLSDAVVAARRAVEQTWFAFADFFDQFKKDDALVLGSGMRSQPAWTGVEELAQQAEQTLNELAAQLRSIARSAENETRTSGATNRREIADDAQAAAETCDEAAAALNAAIAGDPRETVVWLEKQRARERRAPDILKLDLAPIDIAAWLRAELWSAAPRAVLTSATLTVDGEWDFLRERLGLPETLESIYGSPFDYERNARIYIASDMPPIQGPASAVEDALADAILPLVRAAGGRSLALFTAHGTMRRVADRVRQTLEGSGIALAVQGPDGSPAQVIAALRDNPRTVAFGVASLWTGIDVPGENLSQLIICRLPFDRPNDPIQSARADRYENPFIEHQVPTAILKLRQGAGRLIRTVDDRGVIVLLDNRVATKRYGARFLDALPPAPIDEAPLHRIAAAVASFLPPLPPAAS